MAGITVGARMIAAILPVRDVTTAYTSGSVNDAVSKARNDKSSIDLVGRRCL